MDIDPKETPPNNQDASAPNGTDESPLKEARPVYVEPDRPEWRAGATETIPNSSTRRSSRLSQSKTPTTSAHPRSQDVPFSLDNLNDVAPFAPTKDSLEGFSDMKAGLPFQSRPSTTVPRPAAKPLAIPNPPKGPLAPKNVNDHTFGRYIAEMGAYMYEWNQYNKRMLQHFVARQADMETNLSSTWMSSVGDGSMADGKKGYTDYMQALVDDSNVRTHWDVSLEKHQETMRGLGRTREKMKSLKMGNGVASTA